MVIKATFKGIYANCVVGVSLFAKLLIQRLCGEIMCLANKRFYSLVSDMGLAKAQYVVSLRAFAYLVLFHHQKVLLF